MREETRNSSRRELPLTATGWWLCPLRLSFRPVISYTLSAFTAYFISSALSTLLTNTHRFEIIRENERENGRHRSKPNLKAARKIVRRNSQSINKQGYILTITGHIQRSRIPREIPEALRDLEKPQRFVSPPRCTTRYRGPIRNYGRKRAGKRKTPI